MPGAKSTHESDPTATVPEERAAGFLRPEPSTNAFRGTGNDGAPPPLQRTESNGLDGALSDTLIFARRFHGECDEEDEPVRGRILVVDDEAGVRRALCRNLRSIGYVVSEARSAEEAWGVLNHGRVRPDLMVLDLMLPDESGLSFLARLPRPLPLAVIIVSGQGRIPHAVEAMQLGASDFLEKPLGIETLHPKVAKVLREQQRQREQAWQDAVADASEPSLPSEAAPSSSPAPSAPESLPSLPTVPELNGPAPGPLQSILDDSERHVLKSALDMCQGNISAAARVLHLDRGNLFRRLKRLGIR